MLSRSYYSQPLSGKAYIHLKGTLPSDGVYAVPEPFVGGGGNLTGV